MRQCKCGGLIREHDLVDGRVAWACNSCKRYEKVTLPTTPVPPYNRCNPQPDEARRGEI
jgi:hypothetical protein